MLKYKIEGGVILKINRNILLIVAILLLIAIFSTVIIIHNINKLDEPDEVAIGKLYNNNAHILQYGDYIYYQSVNSNAIMRVPVDSTSLSEDVELVYSRANTAFDPRMHIYNNFLYFSYNGDTYIYDLEFKEYKFFCNGSLEYITDTEAICLYNGCLYSGVIYQDSPLIKSYNKLTDSVFTRMYEDNEMIYYSSPTNRNTIVLVGFNKADYTITYFYELEKQYEGEYYNIAQVIANDEYIYMLVSITDKDNTKISSYIIRLEKESLVATKTSSLSELESPSFFQKENSNDLYFSLNGNFYVWKHDNNTYEEYQQEPDTSILHCYNFKFNDRLLSVYLNDNKVGEISLDIEGTDIKCSLDEIIMVDKYVYATLNLSKEIVNAFSGDLFEDGNEPLIHTTNKKVLLRINMTENKIEVMP